MAQCKPYIIDFRSDTVTKPTPSMRNAMATAVVGDDVYGEDPTVNALEKKMALLLGKQAALFVPTGTMSNLIAVMVHCNNRGSEAIVGDMSHVFKYEQGNSAFLGGVMLTTVKNDPDGTFDLAEVESKIRGADIHEPKTSLVVVENTHNMCGGKIVPMEWLEKLKVLATKHSLALHLDGARLFNASQSLGIEPSEVVKVFDSISVCFSKGLGAPLGSTLVGSFSFIRQARRLRKALGGGMRQTGVVAAPCIVALDEIVPALIGDHRRAKFIGEAINALKLSTFTVDTKNQHTNIILVKIDPTCPVTSNKVVERLAQVTESELAQGCVTAEKEGIIMKILTRDSKTIRLVTYFEISDEDVSYAVKKLNFVFKEMHSNKGFFG